MRILLVEDDPLLGDGIATAFRQAAITVDWLRDGVAAAHALAQEAFDLVVLDLGLPRKDGTEVLKEMRAQGCGIPVLVLTARDRVTERVRGLDLGADDYLGKPFDTSELIARVRALYRRSRGKATGRIEHGALTIDPARLSVTYAGRNIDLPRREFALLAILLENAGRIVTREAAQQRLYGWDEDVESNALDVHIHHLRRKLHPSLIRTVRGVGYLIEPGA